MLLNNFFLFVFSFKIFLNIYVFIFDLTKKVAYMLIFVSFAGPQPKAQKKKPSVKAAQPNKSNNASNNKDTAARKPSIKDCEDSKSVSLPHIGVGNGPTTTPRRTSFDSDHSQQDPFAWASGTPRHSLTDGDKRSVAQQQQQRQQQQQQQQIKSSLSKPDKTKDSAAKKRVTLPPLVDKNNNNTNTPKAKDPVLHGTPRNRTNSLADVLSLPQIEEEREEDSMRAAAEEEEEEIESKPNTASQYVKREVPASSDGHTPAGSAKRLPPLAKVGLRIKIKIKFKIKFSC
jgi:hypothetical protein